MKIKAAVVDEKGADFKIRDDVELAPMGPDDLQVHMVASGICHSDEALRIGDAVIGYPARWLRALHGKWQAGRRHVRPKLLHNYHGRS